MSAQEILKLIETVDPADTAKLDEIDARTAFFLQEYDWEADYGIAKYLLKSYPQYTRSRDALKAIRPEGWLWGRLANQTLGQIFEGTAVYQWSFYKPGTDNQVNSPELPTEELAELHAIIQAIEWERSQ